MWPKVLMEDMMLEILQGLKCHQDVPMGIPIPPMPPMPLGKPEEDAVILQTHSQYALVKNWIRKTESKT
jgi:hypothetical protein